MNMSILLAALAIICALASVGVGVRITGELRAHGIRANPLLVRWMIPKYLAEYRRLTLVETGQVGRLWYACVTALVLTAFLGIATIVALNL
jgi:hypothetical protein